MIVLGANNRKGYMRICYSQNSKQKLRHWNRYNSMQWQIIRSENQNTMGIRGNIGAELLLRDCRHITRVSLGWWCDTHIYCGVMPTVKLVNSSISSCNYQFWGVCVCGHEITISILYSKFQVYNTILWIVLTMLDIIHSIQGMKTS